MSSSFLISAVGDISFEGKWADYPSLEPFKNISSIFQKSDLIIGNLEGPLCFGKNPLFSKTTLRGSTGWARVLSKIGFKVLSLANNHIMDYGEKGLFQTISSLKKEGIICVGAGENIECANSPAFFNISNRCIAFLGRSSVIVNSPTYATNCSSGVAFFDLNETMENVIRCKKVADIVVLLMHWGLEEYKYPSPEQRSVAKKLIRSGVDIILGHHPHILQGIENIRDKYVCYSLGNLLFDEFYWKFNDNEGKTIELFSGLSQENRRGGIFTFKINKNKIFFHDNIPTLISSDSLVVLDKSDKRETDFRKLSKKLCYPFYNIYWKIYSLKQEWFLRINPRAKNVINIKKIRKIRIKHFLELYNIIKKVLAIIFQKTTNPYD